MPEQLAMGMSSLYASLDSIELKNYMNVQFVYRSIIIMAYNRAPCMHVLHVLTSIIKSQKSNYCECAVTSTLTYRGSDSRKFRAAPLLWLLRTTANDRLHVCSKGSSM